MNEQQFQELERRHGGRAGQSIDYATSPTSPGDTKDSIANPAYKYVFADGTTITAYKDPATGNYVVTDPGTALKPASAAATSVDTVSAPANQRYLVQRDAQGNITYVENPNHAPEQPKEQSAEDKALTVAQTEYQKAQAEHARAQAASASARTETDRIQAQAQLTSATASLRNAEANLREANERVGLIREQARGAAAEADISGAKAAVAPEKEQLDLQTAQTKYDQAKVELDEARRKQRQAPTDEQARRANDLAVQTAEQNFAKAQHDLEQAQRLAPLDERTKTAAAEQAELNLQQDQLGDLAGLREYIAEVKQMLADGLVTRPQADHLMAARQAGKSPYDIWKDEQTRQDTRADRQLTQRGQDVTAANQRVGTLGTLTGSAFGTIADMNKTAAVGSDAGAGALASLIGNVAAFLGGPQAFQPPKAVDTPPTPGFLEQFGASPALAGARTQPPAQTPQPQPASAQPQTSAPITINIGAGQAPTPTSPAAMGGAMAGRGLGQTGSPTSAAGTGAATGGAAATPAFLENKRPPSNEAELERWAREAYGLAGSGTRGSIGPRAM